MRKRKKLPIRFKLTLFAGLFVLAVTLALWLVSSGTVAVLEPKGTIADQQRNLLLVAAILSAVIILPVFGLTFWISWKYRESNKKARYQPEWANDRRIEALWWGIPLAIITILAVIAFKSAHSLDPFRPLNSDKEPLTIQVVALQWRWLFIYPEQGVATVNYFQIPEDRPISFRITSDAPMNSFWIPQLGGQVYAMAGMETKLHLMADNPGKYTGSSANISGRGFANMTFTAEAVAEDTFDLWVHSLRDSEDKLSLDEYNELAQPSVDRAPHTFAAVDKTLYDTIIMKYMIPGARNQGIPDNLTQGEH